MNGRGVWQSTFLSLILELLASQRGRLESVAVAEAASYFLNHLSRPFASRFSPPFIFSTLVGPQKFAPCPPFGSYATRF
jgi:hypothetical protein